MPEQFYTTGQACKLTKLTRRQFQWWDEAGILCPVRRPRDRVYSPEEIKSALIIKRACKVIRKHPGFIAGELSKLAIQRRYLLFAKSGKLIATTDDPARIIGIAAQCDTSVVLIDL